MSAPTDRRAQSSASDQPREASHSLAVGGGVLFSRLLGLVRDRVLAHLLGIGPWRDLYEVLFRGANLLQNLLGEQALSAAFVPIYSRLKERGARDPGPARRFAWSVFVQVLLAVAAVVLVAWVAAPLLVRVLYPGWAQDPERISDLILGLRILLPMSGVLVLSAWCLAILNSHDRFFLPYVAPVSWNLAILAALGGATWVLVSENRSLAEPSAQRLIVFWGCWGALVGGALQFLVQWFSTLRLLGGWTRPRFASEPARQFRRVLGPALLGRGVVQLSSYIDQALATFLMAGAVAAMGNAFRVYFLASTVVVTTVVVVELPAISRLIESAARESADRRAVRRRLLSSLSDVGFLTVPSSVGLLLFGVPVIAALLQTGQFARAESVLVGTTLGLYALALVPSGTSRLLQNLFFALGDTADPARIGFFRLVLSVTIAVPAMLWLDRFPIHRFSGGIEDSELRVGVWGLALGSVAGAWFEMAALSWRSRRRHLAIALPWRRWALFLLLCLPAGATGWLVARSISGFFPIVVGPLVVLVYALVYLSFSALLRIPESGRVLRRWVPSRWLP